MKIFGIGLAKTGTTTLSKALELLGYKSIHVECNVMEVSNHDGCDTFSINNNVLEENDAIVGTPLSPCYELLANKYPDAFFILTIRDYEGWLNSCSISFTDKLPMDDNHHALHRWLYDSILYDEKKFLTGYINYVMKVLDFFNTVKNQLFLFNLCHGDGWLPLCGFLKKDVPNIPFPHENDRTRLIKK